MSKKVEVFQNIVSEVDAARKRGEGFPLSSLRDRTNELMYSENFFSNRELKVLFKSHYGDDICCSSPQEANKSVMIFLKSLSAEDFADTIQ